MKAIVTVVGKDVKKVETSYIIGKNVKLCCCIRKQSEFLNMLNMELSYDSEIQFLGIYP